MLSVRFESAELPHIPHHQGRRAECIAPFFFVCILTIWELEECLIYNFRRGIDEWSICFWWVFSQLSFRATWRTKGGMPSTVLCLFPMFFLNIEDIRTGGMSHFCVGEVSMNVRSVLGELWVSWVSSHYNKKTLNWIWSSKTKKKCANVKWQFISMLMSKKTKLARMECASWHAGPLTRKLICEFLWEKKTNLFLS